MFIYQGLVSFIYSITNIYTGQGYYKATMPLHLSHSKPSAIYCELISVHYAQTYVIVLKSDIL